jgi:hypothetical protein
MSEEIGQQNEPQGNQALTADQVLAAVEHLYRALEILDGAKKDLSGETVLVTDWSAKLAEAWFEVNKCREYTESIPFMEELLVPCLGSINDAKSMWESAIAWKLGITRSAFLNIMNCIDQAIFEGIRPCLEELETWLSQLVP